MPLLFVLVLEVYVLKQDIKNGCQLSKNQMMIRLPSFCQLLLLFLEKEETSSMMNTPDLPDCVAEISHGIENWLRWKLCKGSEGHLLLNVAEGSIINWGP